MRHRFSLLSGFLPTLVLLVAMMSLGLVWVWQTGIRNQVEDLRGERFQFSLLHVKSALESGLRLGNNVTDLASTEALIARVRDHQPDILSIDVYDAQGTVVFSTDPGGLGLTLPAAWARDCLRPDMGTPWSGQDADGGVQCVGLVNAFDQAAGGVLLRHRWSAGAANGLALPADWQALAFGICLLLLAAGWGAAVAVRPLEQPARKLGTAVLSGLASDELAQGLPDGFGPAEEALQALATQERWLAETDAEADRIDRLEAM